VLEGPGLGEVCLRSEAVMVGYLDDPVETANVLRDGWLLTGDLVRVDEDGFMFVYDRKKDVIIRGGHNVASIEVESTLNEHPAVIESALVGKPHPSLGEDLKAFVVLTEPGAADPDELRAFCAERLADYKVPRDYTFLDELPRNPTGKVLKRELREQLTGAGK
jgi:acyl-CoA synthetase (AMP-forming)/AMP-acid ligase II